MVRYWLVLIWTEFIIANLSHEVVAKFPPPIAKGCDLVAFERPRGRVLRQF